jgi:shikimate dehydrogenase
MLTGLIGNGIGFSLSPALHETEARALGIDLSYELYDLPADTSVECLEAAISGIAARGSAGINVTHPFKRRVMELLDEVAPEAHAIGAVNTLAFEHGKRVGHNTDWSGFSDSLARDLPDVDLACVVQIGAGGAGAATAFALLTAGCRELLINDRSDELAAQLVEHLRDLFSDRTVEVATDAKSALDRADGIVQASPIGMTGHDGMPVPKALLKPEHWVIDIIYQPRETTLLRCARKCGCRTTNGLGMVVAQAARAFEIFTRVAPDIDRMRANLLEIA